MAIVAVLLGGLLSLLAPAAPASALNAGEISFFNPNQAPVTADGGDNASATLGFDFEIDEPGTINGLRFYKSAANTGTHVGYLYNDLGSLMASVTFSGESASGWQTAYFSSPVTIIRDNDYTIAYYAPNGHYAADTSYFHAPGNEYPILEHPNGGGYSALAPPVNPHSLQNATNYWVDPIFQPATTPACPCNVFGNATPGTIDSSDVTTYELGMQFQVYTAGYITGVRFYKSVANTGSHIGKLYTDDGSLLASVTFTGESASGWQQMSFSSPVLVKQRTFYRVSYTDPNGHYSVDTNYFTAISNVMPFSYDPGAGYYHVGYGMPDNSLNGNNYYVDPIYMPISSNQTVAATVDPSFAFNVGNNATACNGESNFAGSAGTATTIALGHLAPSSNVSGGQALTVSGNSGNGFSVFIRGAQSANNLRNVAHPWTDVAGTYGSAAVLGSGERFGYTFADSTASSSVTNPASATFVALDATNRAVMGSSSSASGNGCVTFDAQTAAATPAGSYTATVIYIAVPAF